MEQAKHETLANSGRVNLETGGSCSGSNGKSTDLGNGVLPVAGIVLNSGKTTSAGADAAVLNVNIDRLKSCKRMVNQDVQAIGEPSDEGSSGISGHADNEVVIVVNPEEHLSSVNGETKSFGANIQEPVSNVSMTNQEMHNREALEQTVIVINSQDNVGMSGGNGSFEVKGKELELAFKKAAGDESKTKVPDEEKPSSVTTDIKCGGGGRGLKDDCDGEKVCRICHLSFDGLHNYLPSTHNDIPASVDLIHLGCGCKDELGIAHYNCAEAWFKLKGNRICEICGVTARNITYIGENRFLERRFIGIGSGGDGLSDGGGGCWRGQPFCNLLMALLVIAFVLPWFFRVNVF